MCLTLSKYIFSRSKVLWENQSIENFLSQKSCISSQFTPRPNKSSEATSTTACFDFSPPLFFKLFFPPTFFPIFFPPFFFNFFDDFFFYPHFFFNFFDEFFYTPTFFSRIYKKKLGVAERGGPSGTIFAIL